MKITRRQLRKLISEELKNRPGAKNRFNEVMTSDQLRSLVLEVILSEKLSGIFSKKSTKKTGGTSSTSSGTDTDTDADSDTDTDSDVDADTDTDADTDRQAGFDENHS